MSNRDLSQNTSNRWIKCDFRTQCHQIVTNSVRFCTSVTNGRMSPKSVITQIGNCGRQLRHFCMLVISGLGRSRRNLVRGFASGKPNRQRCRQRAKQRLTAGVAVVVAPGKSAAELPHWNLRLVDLSRPEADRSLSQASRLVFALREDNWRESLQLC
jgi:hypothetical protein